MIGFNKRELEGNPFGRYCLARGGFGTGDICMISLAYQIRTDRRGESCECVESLEHGKGCSVGI